MSYTTLDNNSSVPEEDIIRRFQRSIQNFWDIYRGYADRWHLIYNASTQFQEVAFGDQDGITLRDEALHERFLGCLGGKDNG